MKKRIIRRIIIILTLFASCNLSVRAQTNYIPPAPQVSFAAPEQSAIAKFINYPVSYNAGLPNVSIPIYEINTGELVLPIYLSYHASGVKVSEYGGWAGIGWTLNINPSISKSINGFDDDMGYLANTNFGKVFTDVHYKKDIINGEKWTDETPDDFYYKLLKKSGRFTYRKDCSNCTSYGIETFPFEPITISRAGSQFNITDEDGTLYKFGGVSSGPAYDQDANSLHIVTFKAREIISPSKGDTIRFSYEQNQFPTAVSSGAHNDFITLEDKTTETALVVTTGCSPQDYNKFTPAIAENTLAALQSRYIWGYQQNGSFSVQTCPPGVGAGAPGSSIRESRLTTIQFRGGRIEVIGASGKLSKIRVFNSHNVLLREIEFVLNRRTEREYLDALRFKDASGNIIENYTFNYYGTAIHPLSASYDHWGYNNAGVNPISSGSSAVPFFSTLAYPKPDVAWTPPSVSLNLGYANKASDESSAWQGTLSSIKFPTGGQTYFDYELNKYVDDISGLLMNAGGLRIREIREYEAPGRLALHRVFKYGKNESGGGVIKHIPVIDDYRTDQTKLYYHANGSINYFSRRFQTWRSNLPYDPFFAGGASVLYDEVTEYITSYGDVNVNTGKTVYEYNVTEDLKNRRIKLDPGSSVYIDFKNDSWLYGQLIGTKKYANDGGIYRLITLDTLIYNRKTFANRAVMGAKWAPSTISMLTAGQNAYPIDAWIHNVGMWGYSYDDVPGYTYLEKELHREVTTAGDLMSTKEYFYNNDELPRPSKVLEVNSKNDTVITHVTYPGDYGPGLMGAMVGQNFVGVPVEQYREVLKGGIGNVTDGKLNQFVYGSNHGAGGFLLEKQHSWANVAPVPESSFTPFDGFQGFDSRYSEDIEFSAYTSSGRIQEYKTKDGVVIVILWGYHGRYPVAKIAGADHMSVLNALTNLQAQINSSTSVPNNDANVRTLLNVIRTHFATNPTIQVSTYTYIPLVGVTSETNPAGKITYYEYDSYARLKVVKDQDGNILKQYDYQYQVNP
ncbi:hypothetical protein MKQ68_13575 [Chitinophaga horti]|uniref:YD repeat-containing protein n=1 Tax=Chitinophaga horti TaxID=2920382 RepID=A0ABY6IV75_9BACT|nr:hypothetical protein [Chitinophaga horti]UYQ91123.1 hypothetical protein MKQ68_13575 [Chitinophaga horti]